MRISNNALSNIAAFTSVITTVAAAVPTIGLAFLFNAVACNNSGKYPNCGDQPLALGAAVVLTIAAAVGYTTKKLTSYAMNHFFPEGQNVVKNKNMPASPAKLSTTLRPQVDVNKALSTKSKSSKTQNKFFADLKIACFGRPTQYKIVYARKYKKIPAYGPFATLEVRQWKADLTTRQKAFRACGIAILATAAVSAGVVWMQSNTLDNKDLYKWSDWNNKYNKHVQLFNQNVAATNNIVAHTNNIVAYINKIDELFRTEINLLKERTQALENANSWFSLEGFCPLAKLAGAFATLILVTEIGIKTGEKCRRRLGSA